MLLSREEAEGAWCPFGRVAHQRDLLTPQSTTSVNRMNNRGTGCLADACMAWRWAGWMLGPNGTPPIGPRPLPEDQKGPRLGYCGLAGTPYGAP